MESITLDIAIARDWRDLYAAIWSPEAFPTWGSGLADASLRYVDGIWLAEGPDGPARIRFSAHNAFGVMDHWVTLADGQELYMPFRIVANGAGATVLLTLFRQPGMSEETFARDIAWVRRDLEALKARYEPGT